jgi:hypothetical protein
MRQEIDEMEKRLFPKRIVAVRQAMTRGVSLWFSSRMPSSLMHRLQSTNE